MFEGVGDELGPFIVIAQILGILDWRWNDIMEGFGRFAVDVELFWGSEN